MMAVRWQGAKSRFQLTTGARPIKAIDILRTNQTPAQNAGVYEMVEQSYYLPAG